VVDKEKGRRGCLAGKQRARSIKTGQLGIGFLGPGFPLGSRVFSIRKIPRPAIPTIPPFFIVSNLSIPLSRHRPPSLTLLSFFMLRVRCHLCVTVPNRFAVLIANFIFLCCVPVHHLKTVTCDLTVTGITVASVSYCMARSIVAAFYPHIFRTKYVPTAITCENAVSRGPRVLTHVCHDRTVMSLRLCHSRVNQLIPVL
jgi:hypothetical protein